MENLDNEYMTIMYDDLLDSFICEDVDNEYMTIMQYDTNTSYLRKKPNSLNENNEEHIMGISSNK